MQTKTCILAALILAATPAAGHAQTAGFADPAAIDAAVEGFLGASAGTPGGARGPVDRRLRLAACPADLAIAWHGRGADMVRVECTSGTPWRIFVPVTSTQGAFATVSGPAPAPAAAQVARGQVLTIILLGRGFSVSQQGEAMEAGRVGDWIRVRPEGSRDEVRARIDNPARVIIPLG